MLIDDLFEKNDFDLCLYAFESPFMFRKHVNELWDEIGVWVDEI